MNDQEKDKLFGELGIDLGFITQADVTQALASQKVDEAIGAKKPIGNYLFQTQKLTRDQIGKIVAMQEKMIARTANSPGKNQETVMMSEPPSRGQTEKPKSPLGWGILAIVFAVIFYFTLYAQDPVQEDLIDYINVQIPKFAKMEAEMIADFSSVTGVNAKDEKIALAVISKKVVPTCRKIVEIVGKEISPKTKEVRALHDKYIDAINTEFNAFVSFQLAFQKSDMELVVKANERIIEATKIQKAWLGELETLKKDHSVTIQSKE